MRTPDSSRGAIHPQGTLSRTLEAVERHQERLRSERAKQLSSGQDIEPAWDLGYAAGLHGMLTVWRTVEGISPKSVTAGLQTIAAHVELLKKFPGTERPRAILRSLRGTRMAQFSEHREALGELTPLTNLGERTPTRSRRALRRRCCSSTRANGAKPTRRPRPPQERRCSTTRTARRCWHMRSPAWSPRPVARCTKFSL
ncbi:hypothetical protein [Nesterenkonia pannonica]|uniref:hypothetical protein n=1 Tax=Nesterenkonia pannonica TaxID=1548602 RepID=UPI0021640859|nr:hypothetical protein [Nesterenkonia pannonica]